MSCALSQAVNTLQGQGYTYTLPYSTLAHSTEANGDFCVQGVDWAILLTNTQETVIDNRVPGYRKPHKYITLITMWWNLKYLQEIMTYKN